MNNGDWMFMRGSFVAALVLAGSGVLLSGCRTPLPQPLDPELKQLAEAGSVSFDRGEYPRAAQLYGKALERARLIDNQHEVARNAYNLGLCRVADGHLTEAMSLFRQAASLIPGAGIERARVLLAEAEVARLSADSSESVRLAREALAAGGDREVRVQAMQLQGEADVAAGRFASALVFYNEAVAATTLLTPPLLRARGEALAVTLVQAGVMAGDAAVYEEARSQWLKKAGQYKMMVDALVRAAELHELKGRNAEAADCRIRAAQSLLAAGEKALAGAQAERAIVLAGQAHDINRKALAESLVAELK